MNTSTWILVIITSALLVYTLIKDQSLAVEGLKVAGSTIMNNLVLLLTGFVLAGLVQVLIPKELIVNWLGNQAGLKAILIGCAAGGLIPGSPYAVFPIAAGFYAAGAGLGAMIGFITAWSLWSISRFPVEIALISPRSAIIRYAITFIFPPISGLIAYALEKTLLKA
jgi:uncharacterized membrane protein YraQ (UPF0718 family)